MTAVLDEKTGAQVAAETATPAGEEPSPASAAGRVAVIAQQGANTTSVSTGDEKKPAKGQHMAPSECFTGHQKFYIFALDGVGGMAVSAGVNFAIAYVMYTTQDTAKNPIRLFELPNTLAGDAAVTIIIQCILTWFVEWGLVAYDLSKRSVQPVVFVAEPTTPFLRWLFLLGDYKPATVLANVLQQALRGFMLCVPAFLLLWPISVGALTAVGEKSGGDWNFEDRWTPQFFKFILGGTLGLLTTPLMAMFWLIKAGWEGKKKKPVSEALSV